MVEFEQYEVHWINLDPTLGSEMNKNRPCVIVSPNELNKFLRTIVIVPITSIVRHYPWRVACTISGRKGSIATDQIKVVDKSRIGSRIVSLTKEEIKALKRTLTAMFID